MIMHYVLTTILLSSGLHVSHGLNAGDGCTIISRRETGICDVIEKCPRYVRLKELVDSGLLPTSAKLQLQAVICGYRGIKPLLCCAEQNIASVGGSPTSFRPQTTPRPILVTHRATRRPIFSSPTSRAPFPPPSRPAATVTNIVNTATLLPTGLCGVSKNPDRIVGGKEAFLGAWPWMAVIIGRAHNEGRRTAMCGATLINSRYVVTAAHCIRIVDAVRLGEHDFRTDTDCERSRVGTSCSPPPQDIRPESVTIHPRYSQCTGQSHCNDIALVRLSREVTFTDYVRPICLPVNFELDLGYTFNDITNPSTFATVAGWGSINQFVFDIQQSPVLKDAKVNIRNCEAGLQGVFCARGDKQGTCRGDSGGPMMIANRFGTKFYLLGITSTGTQVCAAEGLDVKYTAVPQFISWILQNIFP